MFELILGTVIAVLFSCLFLWAYRRGLKDGLSIKDNKPIEPIQYPVDDIKEVKEMSESEKIQAQFMSNLFGYDGNKQEEVKDA